MTNKRKTASPKAGTLMGKTASQTKYNVEPTTEFSALPEYSIANRFFDILTGSKNEP